MRLAILDDYHSVSLDVADWTAVAEKADIHVFTSHLGDEDHVAAALAPFEILVAMRERSSVPESLLRRLPTLQYWWPQASAMWPSIWQQRVNAVLMFVELHYWDTLLSNTRGR